MTINATAAILLAMYLVVAEERGIPRQQLRGTVQNDVLKEYVARGTYIFPLEPSLRLITDLFRFVLDEGMPFNPISISGYHMREAGCTAVQEIGFTFANALEYLDRARRAGLDIRAIAPRMSFFFAAHNDLFEEAAKFRAARRLWATLLKDEFGASDAACRLRFHTQTAGSTLTAQEPENNVVRVTVQALAAILGGAQSLHTNSQDEALGLPSQHAVHLALRTQQVLAHESGVADTIDPLAGSYAVEALTDEIERRTLEYLRTIDEMGGALAAIEQSYPQSQIEEAAYRAQKAIENREALVVGVNAFADEPSAGGAPHAAIAPQPVDPALEGSQRERLSQLRAARDGARVADLLGRVDHAARTTEPLMPLFVEAVEAGVTLGEICDVLRGVWGEYRPA
jgi:methylmalonyl-CoA mutase N-terminal domain/subunit